MEESVAPHADLYTEVFVAMGAASVAWTSDGVFMSEFAKEVGDNLVKYILEHYTKK